METIPHSYYSGSDSGRFEQYTGPHKFKASVKVVVNDVTFWIDDETRNFYYKFTFKSKEHSGTVASWRDKNERQYVESALLNAHRNIGYIPKEQPVSYYSASVKGINQGMEAINRTVFIVVKWVVLAVLFLVGFYFVSAFVSWWVINMNSGHN